MKKCTSCKSIANFMCNCSISPTYLCEYHIFNHETHSEFKFILTKNLKNNLKAVVKQLDDTKSEINLIKERLAESQKQLIASINKAYFDITLKLNQSKIDIDNALKKLKELKYGSNYDYLSVIGFILQPNKLQKNHLIRFEDRTSLLLRKIPLHLKVETITVNLMKTNDFCLFDNDFFEFEIKQAALREECMTLVQGLPKSDYQNYLKLFYRNMNKRQFHISSFSKNQDPLIFDIEKIHSRYSKKVHRYYYQHSQANNEISEKVFDAISGYSYINYISVKNSIHSEYDQNLLISALKNKKAIKHLNLSQIFLTEEFLNEILQSLDSYKERIRSLILSKNLFCSSGCNIVNNYLPGFTGLRDLNLSYNEIGTAGIINLQAGLSELKSLEELNIKHNQLGAEGIEILMKSICYLPHLSVLNVANNEFGDEGAMVIAGYLRYMKLLMILYVDFVISLEATEVLCDSAFKYTKIIKYKGRDEMVEIKTPILD